MNVIEAIQKRKSIFPNEFTGELIDSFVIESLLQLANQAPSHKKTEPWRFRVIEGDAKDRLGEFFKKTYKQNTPEDECDDFKMNKLKKKVDQSSHVIILSMMRDPQERLPEWEEIAAMSCAIQNLWLAAAHYGIGGYWSSPGFYIKPIDEFVDLEEGETCYGFFYLGIPAELPDSGSEKGNWKDKVTWITQ